MWRDEDGVLHTNEWADPAAALGPALGLVDDEALATGPERMSAELEGMLELLCAQLSAEEWDPTEESAFAGEWLPADVLEEAMTEEPGSIADLVVAVAPRWRLDVLMLAADRVDVLLDE